MPRSNNTYSAKHIFSPEVKSISAKRLYRGVVDCTRKLDVGRQHRRNVISLFQPEQVKLRHKLREACEKLMFTYPSEYGRKAEEILWRKVYYDVIHAVKSSRKFQSNAPGTLQQRHLEPHFRQFLYSAIGFYHYLLLRLQTKAKPGLVNIDFPLSSQSMPRNSSLINQRTGFSIQEHTRENDEKEIEEWVKNTTYRLLVCLGDLSRYQMEFGVNRSRPIRYYKLSLLAQPSAGMPHNQLATLAGHHMWWGLTAAYHYCHSLHAELSFDGAEGNLQKLLDRNKKLFYQLPIDALDGVISTDEYKKEHTRIFIISFLYLCDLLRPKTYATDVETTGLCKRLIDALHVCLSHMSMESNDEDKSSIDAKISDGGVNTWEMSMQSKSQQKSDSKRYCGKSSIGSVRSARHQHSQQHRLNGDIVFKICVMCLVNVYDLQSCRSNRSSAAIAFTLAFFSHLLGHLIQHLSAPADALNGSGKESSKDLQADGDNVNEKNGIRKMKKTRSHLRRRRRTGRHEDNLSEGEDDVMGGGDAANDSELSEPDSDVDSDCLSDSSGSVNRLSQEDLSSQEEDIDIVEGGFSSTSPHPPLVETKSKVESPPPSLAVASLQDLSNKMFQPSPRRKITLAPSFLQNLTPSAEKHQSDDITNNHTSDQINDALVLKLNGTSSDFTEAKTEENDNKKDASGDLVQVIKADSLIRSEDNFNHLLALSRHHHVMAAIKLLSDWLTANERVAAACAKNSRALWSRLVCLINLLPTEREMLNRDQIRNDAISSAQVKAVIDSLEKSEEARKAKKEADEKAKEAAAVKEAASTDKKIKIEKRKATEENEAKKPPPWHVATALPEDYTLHMMKAVRDASLNVGIDLSQPYKELTDLQQCVIRSCRLRHLCRFLSATEGVEIDVDDNDANDERTGNERFTGPEEEQVDPQMELEAVEAMRKARLMKDMAASRLRNEVKALETSLGTSKSRDSTICLYLVPDTGCLCRELIHVRRLVASERFLMIIPKAVIDGLDALKKELQGARDAIRYLETEFKKGNRFIRAQANEEISRKPEREKAKIRRDDMEAWRFYHIIEYCRYLLQREAEKTKSDQTEHNGLVTILTPDKESCSQHLVDAFTAARTSGIQIKSAAVFIKSWLKSKS